MDFQLVIVILIFLAAVFYVARLIYNSLTVKKSCGSNCKCGVDFSNINVDKPIQ